MPLSTANGRFVAFASTAILAPDDTSAMVSIYVHDRRTHHTQLASINPSGDAIRQHGLVREPRVSDRRFPQMAGSSP
jgi:hypothetical protein